VGVHSPEFDFEKNYDNVKAAVQKFGITYPVILDNNHGTWNVYGNMYWPRDYLIDTQGYIRYDHIGRVIIIQQKAKFSRCLPKERLLMV
jgi:REP element-mobilizing transposase RayT